ncbi:MAG: hypothetical protein GY903_00410 [Fuerstiella sp.]|nr:hypothetical protein [Fuerstiella sp.]MCP4852940.1 hypothetical protein [Fuerstiella sp.]
MSFLLHPLQVFAAMLNERVRHEQEKRIEFLRAETEVLLEQLGDKRILLSDDERRLLAVKGMALEKEDLEKFCAIVQSDTIRRWHRELVEGTRVVWSIRFLRIGLNFTQCARSARIGRIAERRNQR